MNEKTRTSLPGIRPECKVRFDDQGNDIDGIKRSIFGDDGLHGMLGCLKEKVSKKNVMKISIGMASILAIFVIAGMTSWGDAKEKISGNKTSICVLQKELTHIKKTTDKIEKNQMKPKELLRAIEAMINSYYPYRETEVVSEPEAVE